MHLIFKVAFVLTATACLASAASTFHQKNSRVPDARRMSSRHDRNQGWTSDPCSNQCPPTRAEQTVCVDAKGEILEVGACEATCRHFTILNFGGCDSEVRGLNDQHFKEQRKQPEPNFRSNSRNKLGMGRPFNAPNHA